MSGRRSIVSVRMCAPSLRANAAGMASSKNSQTCPPLPERDRSRAAGRFMRRHVSRMARRILLPMRLVEIGRQEEAGLVLKHRVDAHDEITAGIILAGKMPANHIVGDGKEAAMRAFGALDLGLLAQAPRPLVGTRRLIAGLAGLATLEATRIDIVASTKERAKQGDLGLRRRTMMDVNVFWGHCVMDSWQVRRGPGRAGRLAQGC